MKAPVAVPLKYPRHTTSLPVLYADQYGFHNGVRLWRGYFNGTATGAFINVERFAWDVVALPRWEARNSPFSQADQPL
jgi:hypothetical protein